MCLSLLFIDMIAAQKVVPPILLCWPIMSETDGGGIAVEAEPSHQYSVEFLPCNTWQQRGSLTEWCVILEGQFNLSIQILAILAIQTKHSILASHGPSTVKPKPPVPAPLVSIVN